MAGQVKDREAFQRLSFLYQVSLRRGSTERGLAVAGPRVTAPPSLGRPLRPCAGPREPGASEVLLPHGENHCKAARLAAVRLAQSLAEGGKNRKIKAGTRTTFSLYPQGPLGEENPLSWLLFPPHSRPDLHTAPET